MLMVSQVFSSVGIGLLIGTLLGLSSAPVVGLVVGSVTALLASLLGISLPKKDGPPESEETVARKFTLIGVRAGCFGLSCVVGILGGIYLRTHNVLSPAEPGLPERFAELTSIGFTPGEARQILVDGATERSGGPEDAPSVRDTILFSISSEACEKMAIDRFASLSAAADYYEQMKQEELARVTRNIDREIEAQSDKLMAVRAVLEVLCEDSRQ